MKLIGCDLSTTSSGLSFFVDGKLTEYINIKPKVKDTDERIYEMSRLIGETLDKWNPDIAYLEIPQGANLKIIRNIAKLMGGVLGWCSKNNCRYHEINPAEWRKYALSYKGKLSRNEFKELSIQRVKETYDIDVNDDVADAINIGDAAILIESSNEDLF